MSITMLSLFPTAKSSKTRRYGFSLRAVVLGVIGARSTKWLYKVNAFAVSMRPVQWQEYLYYPSQVTCATEDLMLADLFLNAIMFPLDEQAIVHEGSIEFRGWAYSGGKASLVFLEPGDMTEKHYWTWQLWKIRLPVDASSCAWDLHVTSSSHRIKIYSIKKSKLAKPLEFSLEDQDEYLRATKKYPREP
ncbi:hypothetical protein BKA93DRAFT_750231 [Sparassis latifolia]